MISQFPIESDQPMRINLIEHAVDKDGDALAASIIEQPREFSLVSMVVENDNVNYTTTNNHRVHIQPP